MADLLVAYSPCFTCKDKSCSLCELNMYRQGILRQEKWISVEERVPDNYRPVLVVCESTTISAGALIAIGSFGGGLWSLGGADGTLYLTKYMQFVVTHWMPLPTPPAEVFP